MFEWFRNLFREPKVRVRKISPAGPYVYGTKEYVRAVTKDDQYLLYWLIRWDDDPSKLIVVPSWNFVWHSGYWTTYPK